MRVAWKMLAAMAATICAHMAHASVPSQPPPSAVTTSSRCTADTGPEVSTTLAQVFADDGGMPDFAADFDAMDTDNDGRIGVGESRRYFNNAVSYASTIRSQVLVGNVPDLADENDDGKVIKKEFLDGMTRLWNTSFTSCAGLCDSIDRKLTGCGYGTSVLSDTANPQAIYMMRGCRLGAPAFDPFAQCVRARSCDLLRTCFDMVARQQCGQHMVQGFAVAFKSVGKAADPYAYQTNGTTTTNGTSTVGNNATLLQAERAKRQSDIYRWLGLSLVGVVATLLSMFRSLSLLLTMLALTYAAMFITAVKSFSTAGDRIALRGPIVDVCSTQPLQ